MRKKILKYTLIIFFTSAPLFISNSFAGMGGGGHSRPCGGPFPPCPVPLDGGISLLLIAGATYGGKKIYDQSKKNHL
jgi:hypothetical protein